MPHMSPISWIIALLSLWMSLSLMASMIWWYQSPSISSSLNLEPHKANRWDWS